MGYVDIYEPAQEIAAHVVAALRRVGAVVSYHIYSPIESLFIGGNVFQISEATSTYYKEDLVKRFGNLTNARPPSRLFALFSDMNVLGAYKEIIKVLKRFPEIRLAYFIYNEEHSYFVKWDPHNILDIRSFTNYEIEEISETSKLWEIVEEKNLDIHDLLWGVITNF